MFRQKKFWEMASIVRKEISCFRLKFKIKPIIFEFLFFNFLSTTIYSCMWVIPSEKKFNFLVSIITTGLVIDDLGNF